MAADVDMKGVADARKQYEDGQTNELQQFLGPLNASRTKVTDKKKVFEDAKTAFDES